MKKELPKAYDFKSTEPRIYAMWEEGGYFKPWNDPNKPDFDPNIEPFVIAIPPPNVTGELHIGHSMFVSVEDLMIRYHRMKGYSTLWIPGSDHAGIATHAKNLSNAPGNGSTNTVASSRTRFAASAPPATGAVNASPSTMG